MKNPRATNEGLVELVPGFIFHGKRLTEIYRRTQKSHRLGDLFPLCWGDHLANNLVTVVWFHSFPRLINKKNCIFFLIY